MHKIKFEDLTPGELLQVIQEESIVYLPVGSMEWHGPHMGMGVDSDHAYAIAAESARKTGGVVMPALYIGTESQRSAEALKKIGFRGSEKIVGMDFPHNILRSMYWPEDIFESIIRQHIIFLSQMGFKNIVIVNGHGADNQCSLLEKIASECCVPNRLKVISFLTFSDTCGVKIGHAALLETSLMMELKPETVHLDTLSPVGKDLKYTEYAIVDNDAFAFGGGPDYVVKYDPRDATAEIGRQAIAYVADCCVEVVKQNRIS